MDPRRHKSAKVGPVQVGLMSKSVIIASSLRCSKAPVAKGLHRRSRFARRQDRAEKFLSGITGDISIDNLGVYYASEELNDVAFFGSDAFQEATQLPLETPRIPGRKFPKGVKVSAEILVSGVNLLDQLASQNAETTASKEQQSPIAKDEAGKAKEISHKGSAYWIEAKKAIGPLSLGRIGLSYEAPVIGIKFDAGLQLAFCHYRWRAWIKLSDRQVHHEAQRDLGESEISFGRRFGGFFGRPLTIAGGLLKVEVPVKVPGEPPPLQLDGFLLIRTEILTVNALGSYADMNGTAVTVRICGAAKGTGRPGVFLYSGPGCRLRYQPSAEATAESKRSRIFRSLRRRPIPNIWQKISI